MSQSKKILNLWLPVITWAIFIFLISSYPTSPVSEIRWEDFVVKKTAHVVEYAALTLLLYRALKGSGISPKEAGVYSIIFAVLFGTTDEFHQSFTPGRDPKARDVVFDTIGSGLAIYFIWKLLPKAPKKLRNWGKKLRIL